MTPNNDVAALAAASIAVSLAIINPPGPYDGIDLMVGVSMFILVIAYGYCEEMPRLSRRLAVAAILGLSVVPIVGFGVDYFFPKLATSVCGATLRSALRLENPESMRNLVSFVVWVIAGVIAFALDRRSQSSN